MTGLSMEAKERQVRETVLSMLGSKLVGAVVGRGCWWVSVGHGGRSDAANPEMASMERFSGRAGNVCSTLEHVVRSGIGVVVCTRILRARKLCDSNV